MSFPLMGTFRQRFDTQRLDDPVAAVAVELQRMGMADQISDGQRIASPIRCLVIVFCS